jgi:endonuclease YncB( thermonuclease family)
MFSWLTGRRRVYANEISVVDGDSIHWRSGGWGADGQQSDGAMPYRLDGYDAPEVGGKAKTEREAEWGEAAKQYLKEKIERANKLKLRNKGYARHGQRVAILYIDGADVADIMIGAKMAQPIKWSDTDHIVRPNWDELWEELRPLSR